MKPLLVSALLTGALTFPLCAQDEDPPTAPPLIRIESGSHSKTISAISADAASRYALTASDDQTARLWDLQTGKLVQTFRPAAVGQKEGDLYAAAISPDSSTVVFGGRTGRLWSGNKTFGFYVYSRRGAFIQAIKGLKAQILHMAFSPDGQYLAASTDSGSVIYRVSDWSSWEFPEASWIDVSGPSPRRAVLVKAKEVQIVGLAKDEWVDGGAVEGDDFRDAEAVFSSDGKRILLKSQTLYVVSTDKLDTKVSFDISRYPPYHAVFSKDGRSIYGTLNGGQLAVWPSDGSKGPALWTLVPDAERNSTPLYALAALGDGRVLYTSGRSGEWGVAGPTPEKTTRTIPNLIDTSEKGVMGVAFDGSEVLYGPDNSRHIVFSVRKRIATIGGDLDAASGPPQIYAGSQARSAVLPDNDPPVINGVSLPIDPGPRALTCYSVFPDAIYLASERSLYGYRPNGRRVWKRELAYLPTLIRRSGDGKYIVIAGRDGAYHWHAASNGKPLFKVFISPDGRWVMWTQSGYYDASPGGEDLIGWQVNRGGKGPITDFYSGSRFRSQFYRPELFPALLKTGDEDAALRSLAPANAPAPQTRGIDAVLPPVVTILSPDPDVNVSSTTLALRYSVSSPNEPVTSVAVKIDGRPVPTSRGLTPADNQVQIEIPQHDCQIGIIAQNRFGAGDPATVRVHWNGTAAQSAKPTLFVVSVGVSQYANPALRLGLPAKDATDLAAAFKEQQGRFYGNVQEQLLVDGQATRASVLKAISGVRRDARQGDFVAIFLAGHGAADDSKSYYYLASDADPADLLTTAVPFSGITEMVSQIKAHTVLFVDTCHSGNLNQASLAALADINAIANGLSDESVGAVVFTASTGSQFALEDPAWGNGAFTKALVEGLHGNAADQGEITISTLERWVGKRVKNLTCGKQTPVCAKRVPDFSIGSGATASAPAVQTCSP